MTVLAALIAGLLVQFWPLTETTEASSSDRCVAVSYRGISYIAVKAERSRVTDKVTLTMPGGWEVIGTPPPPTPEEQRQIEESQRAFEACVREQEEEQTAREECLEKCQEQADDGSFESHLEGVLERIRCPSECGPPMVFSCMPPMAPSAPRRIKSGRKIQLKGYDAIYPDTRCDCPDGTPCIGR